MYTYNSFYAGASKEIKALLREVKNELSEMREEIKSLKGNNTIALFTVNFSHLHYNVFEHGCEAISGRNCKIARNSLTSTFKNIVM